jgi:hydroxylamine reductase (hybrid-cluster protein)
MNILNTLQKEIDKGNKYITNLGVLITSEKIEAMARTEYLKQVKGGKCDNITFDKFLDNYIAENFTETYEIFETLTDLLTTKQTEAKEVKDTEEMLKKVEEKAVTSEPKKSKYTWI